MSSTTFNLKGISDLELSKENILKKLDEQVIFENYFGQAIDLSKNYSNPLRIDNSPGCKFFIGKNKRLLFIDFARKASVMDCFQFIQKRYHCDFQTALKIINKDFRLGLGGEHGSLIKDLTYETVRLTDKYYDEIKKEIPLKCLKREWTKKDLEYWEDFGITLDILNFYNVVPTEAVYKGNKLIWRNFPNNPIYTYVFPNEKKKKIYRPLEKNRKFKFLSSAEISTVYQGYDQLPEKGDLLIITKSMKDVMTLYSLGYNAIAPNGEGYCLDSQFLEFLEFRFDNIVVLFDNDLPGLEAAKRLYDEHKLFYVLIPSEQFRSKDISEYYYYYGEHETKKLLKKMFGL